ncbi:MAG TPA: D-2-hydroxyacid dehydrogenase, partial [Chloroflexota bacterium]|nr:D-2-hydroxyacid dehydrogenase [Chloroflexota bacterium]
MSVKLVLAGLEDPRLPERIREVSSQVNVVVTHDDATALREIADADALYGRITPALLAAAGKLRWIQSPAIGLERTMFPELIAHP